MQRTQLLKWALARLKPREWDTNKGLVGEALALLLQASAANAQALADLNGIDTLLQARFWSRRPWACIVPVSCCAGSCCPSCVQLHASSQSSRSGIAPESWSGNDLCLFRQSRRTRTGPRAPMRRRSTWRTCSTRCAAR